METNFVVFDRLQVTKVPKHTAYYLILASLWRFRYVLTTHLPDKGQTQRLDWILVKKQAMSTETPPESAVVNKNIEQHHFKE